MFVSDIETSRDVKSIVTRLKDRGRLEYQKHKTVHHPWGTFTMLDMRDDFSISKLIIYPGCIFEVNTEPFCEKHLLVLDGSGQATKNNDNRQLNKRDFVDLIEKQTVKLENGGQEPLIVLEVNWNAAVGLVF